MEAIDSSSSTCSLQLLPGFRFHPTDEELVVHYLKKKSNSLPLPASIIAEIDLYKFDPWELPAKASFGEEEWYFFSPRDRKYPNGARPNRAATSGYWKATGTDKPVLTARGTQKVGVKKALVFYQGKPPKGIKTNWIMHEYRLMDHSNKASYSLKPPSCDQLLHRKGGSLRLDDWVLCRIYKKNIAQRPLDSMEIREDNEMMMGSNSIVPSLTMSQDRSLLFQAGGVLGNNSNSYASNDHQQQHAYDMVFPAKRGLHSLYNNNWSSEAANQHDQNLMKNNSDLTHHQLPQSSSDEAVLGSGINVGEEGVLPQQHESYEVPGINCWYST